MGSVTSGTSETAAQSIDPICMFNAPMSDLVEVTAEVDGHAPSVWALPRKLLCERSEYLELQLRDERVNSILLNGYGIYDYFELFVRWLLTGNCEFNHRSAISTKGMLKWVSPSAYRIAINACLLGYSLNSVGFVNYCMHHIFDLYCNEKEGQINPNDVELVFSLSWAFLPRWTGLLRFFQALLIHCWGTKTIFVDLEGGDPNPWDRVLQYDTALARRILLFAVKPEWSKVRR